VHAAGLEVPREVLAVRIGERVDAMVEAGVLEEVAVLTARGLGSWLTATQAIGYAEFARHLAGELTLAEAVAGTVKRTRSLARRQAAWFARDPRIRWVPVGGQGASTAIDALQAALTEGPHDDR
jgi:tRNA dimethylallyltransferase